MFPERHYQDFKVQQTSEGPILTFMVGESGLPTAPLASGEYAMAALSRRGVSEWLSFGDIADPYTHCF